MKSPYLFLFAFIYCLTSTSCKKEDVAPDLTPSSYTISVFHHISRDDNQGNAVTNAANVELMMSHLNHNFNPWKIYFETSAIEFVDNTAWNTQFIKQDDFIDSRVLAPFEDPNSLNIFYFNELANYVNGTFEGTIGATALFPDQGNNVKLSASAYEADNTSTLTHEVGHYLGLYHTSDDNADDSGRFELVNGNNCEDAGDFICDTPASPDLNDSNIDECTCAYTGTDRDEQGALYTPAVFNFMTQWAGSDKDGNKCRRQFSQGQFDLMKHTLSRERAYLIE